MGALKHKTLSQFDLTNQFTHLFFLGDLNYRIDQLGATEIVEYAKKFDHYSIYSDDQLKREKDKKRVFVGFGERGVGVGERGVGVGVCMICIYGHVKLRT